MADAKIEPKNHARNIGVIFDNTMSMKHHISAICSSCAYQLRSISSIRPYLTTDACETLVHAFIISRLGYASATLYGLPKVEIKRLQRLQNMAARIVSGTRKYDSITHNLMSLHWLPVQERIIFKTLILTFKAINGSAPVYIRELMDQYIPTRTLRSMDQPITLQVFHV